MAAILHGLFVYDDDYSFGHGGMWPGYRTQVTHYRESGITIAVQSNRDGGIDLPSLVAQVEELSSK